jgi:hypothetical protein
MSLGNESQICLTLWINDSPNDGFRFNLKGKAEFIFDLHITVRELLDELKGKLGVHPSFNVISISKRMSSARSIFSRSRNFASVDRESEYMTDNLPDEKREQHLMPHQRLMEYDLSEKEDIFVYFACELDDSVYITSIEEPIAKPKEDELGDEWNDIPTFSSKPPQLFTKRVTFFDECDDPFVRGPTCSSNSRFDYHDRLLDDD